MLTNQLLFTYNDSIVKMDSLVKRNSLMKVKKFKDTLPGMKLAKIVRDFAGLRPWAMHKRMGKKTIQSYLSFERSAKRMTLTDYFRLESVYIEAGGSKGEFERLARDCASKEKP